MSHIRIPAFLAAVALIAAPAAAQTEPATPVPPKRPPIEEQQAAVAAPPAIKPPPAVGGLEPVAVGRTSFTPEAMTADQRATLERIDAYLNSLRVMSGSFTQVGPDGSRTQGKFWVSKPGKLRFQYSPPSRVELVADGRSVAVRDRKLNTQDLYLLRQTPLRFLLANKIDLIEDSKVVSVFTEPEWVTVVLEEGTSLGGKSRIQLMFSGSDYTLKQWTVTDAQGYDTTVAIFDVDTTSKPADKLFYINEIKPL
jgi:outer membrane lipoprotein-sorting protein